MNVPSFTIISDDNDFRQFKPKLDQILNDYKAFSYREQGNKELEVRFGKTENRRFVPGITKQEFIDLKRVLPIYLKEYRTETTNIQKFGDVRKITSYNDDGSVDDVKYQRKTPIQNTDLNLYPYSIRVAYSKEINFTPKPDEKYSSPEYEKTQTRTQYIMNNKQLFNVDFVVDLTKISSNNKITYEIELEFISTNISQEDLIKSVKFIYSLLTNRISAIGIEKYDSFTRSIKKTVLGIHDTFNIRYFKPTFYFDNKPEALYYNNLNQVSVNYGVTNKLDGIYYNLFIIKDGVSLLNGTTFEIVLSSSSPIFQKLYEKIKDNILVGELYKGKLYLFDSVLIQNQYVANEPHEKRILSSNVDFVISELSNLNLPSISFTKKKFIYTGNIVNDIQSEINYMKSIFKDFENENDGIILFPVNGNFMSKIYKWKFPSRITIDGKLLLKSSSDNEKVFEVLFYKSGDKDESILVAPNTPLQLFVNKDNPFFEQLENNMIVELGWGSNKLIVERIRYDKTSSNYIDIAKNTYEQMIKPMDFDNLIKSLSTPQIPLVQQEVYQQGNNYRKFANLVKRYLIQSYINTSSNVLDLGAGYGGDLKKYEVANPNLLYLVEPYFYEGLLGRLKEVQNKTFVNKVKTLQSIAEDTNKIKEFIGKNEISNINMMNSITFFMSDQELPKLKNTLNLLEKDGTFVCMYMDGERTFKQLKETGGTVSSSFYEIKDLEPSKTSDQKYTLSLGHKIHFSFKKGVTVTEEGQDEYLVPSNILAKQLYLDPTGFEKKSSFYLDDFIRYQEENPSKLKKEIVDVYNLLTPDEKSLVRLYRYDIYTKTKYKNVIQEQKEREQSLIAIPSGTAKKIDLPVSNEMFRLGVIGDGSCFVHSIVAGVDYNVYKTMTVDEKKMYVYEIRKLMAKNLTLKTWSTLGNGSTAVLLIEESLSTVMTDDQRTKYLDILPTIDKSNYFVNYIKAVSSVFPNLNFIIQKTFSSYKQNLENNSFWINSYYLEYFSIFFEVNIFAIKDITKSIIPVNVYNPSWPSVFILNLDAKYVGQEHFELLIRVTKNKILTSLFEPTDKLVITVIENNKQIKPYTETIKVVTDIVETPVMEKKDEVREIISKPISKIENIATEIINQNFMFTEPIITFEYIIPTSELSLSTETSINTDKEYINTLRLYFTSILTEINLDRFNYKSYNDNHLKNRKKYQEMAFSDLPSDEYVTRIISDLKDKDLNVNIREAIDIIKEFPKLLSNFDIFYETMSDIFSEGVFQNQKYIRELYYDLKQ